MSLVLDKFIKSMPKVYNTGSNSLLYTLLSAIAGSDNELLTQIQNTKAQLFVNSANGTYLNTLASNLGVARPLQLGMSDTEFQNLIPNLSFKPKTILKSFYDTADVFWGQSYSRTNVTGSNSAPFTVSVGDTFTVTIDNQITQSITAKIGDIAVDGAATAIEIVNILNQISRITANVIENLDGSEQVNIQTNTPGLRGSLQFDAVNYFSGVGPNFVGSFTLDDLNQRVAVYQINPGEVTIELPAFVPIIRDTLRGAHHFHTTATIEPAIPPANGIWQGGFLFSRTQNPFVPTSVSTTLTQNITKGSYLTTLSVNSTANMPTSAGRLVIDFGLNNQEYNINYYNVLNSNTIEISASAPFAFDHFSGATVNIQMAGQISPYLPRSNGQDLAIYLPSMVEARTIVQDLLSGLAAEGVIVNFVILSPTYTYTIISPFQG